MRAEVFWIPGDRTGRIGIISRPRGGDWLVDEMRALREAGVDIVTSLLTPAEICELALDEEAALCRMAGMAFCSLSIPDRGTPATPGAMAALVGELSRAVEAAGAWSSTADRGSGARP